MTGQETGQGKPKVNGKSWANYVQWWGPAAVLIILAAVGVPKAWQAAVQPQLDASRKLTDQLADQIPLQTEVLQDIRDQGKESLKLQKDTLDQLKERQREHEKHAEEHRDMCEAMKAIAEGRG